VDYGDEDLGKVIRARREACKPKLSQKLLGEVAGYGQGAGAGVAISRIESGQMRPGRERLAGIATGLGTTVDELKRDATGRSAAEGHASGRAKGADRSTAKVSVRDRLNAVQSVVEDRTTKVTALGNAFNAAHDRARDDFFLRFLDDAVQIEGAPEPPEPVGLSQEEQGDPRAQAHYRVSFTSSVVANALGGVGGAAAGAAAGGAAAYATFTAAAMFGTASTGAAISGLSGVAATNATLALLGGGTLAAGGAGVAGGTMLLAGVVAAPAALLAVGGIIWMARRNKQKEAELAEKLDAAEAELAATQTGFDALVEMLARATEVLDYIGLHAAHAQRRWSSQLRDRPLSWSKMTAEQQERYQEFLTIAGCQLTVASMNVGAFMAARGADLDDLVSATHEVLNHARSTVESLA